MLKHLTLSSGLHAKQPMNATFVLKISHSADSLTLHTAVILRILCLGRQWAGGPPVRVQPAPADPLSPGRSLFSPRSTSAAFAHCRRRNFFQNLSILWDIVRKTWTKEKKYDYQRIVRREEGKKKSQPRSHRLPPGERLSQRSGEIRHRLQSGQRA